MSSKLFVKGLSWPQNASAVGTGLSGYLPNVPGGFAETIARLLTMTGQDPFTDWTDDDGDGKVAIQFIGRFNGILFTLYDYKGDDDALHIGSAGGLDIEALKALLVDQLPYFAPKPFTATTSPDYDGKTYSYGELPTPPTTTEKWCWRHKQSMPGVSACRTCAAEGVLTHLTDGPGQLPAGTITEVK